MSMTEIPKVEVRELGKHEYGLFVNNQLVGTSKLECDAQMQMHFLNDEFKKAFDAGCKSQYTDNGLY